jgi:hypothetical protein
MSPSSIPKLLPGTERAAPPVVSRLAVTAGALAALAFAGSVLLWAHYGTTVFFETIRTGFAACFG